MKIADPDGPRVREVAPRGFTLIPLDQGTCVIRHRRTGMGCMNAFLVVWLTGWVCFCVFLVRQFLDGNTMQVPLWGVLVFWGGAIVVFGLLLYVLFCRTSFRLDRDQLAVEVNILGLKWRQFIPKNSIKRFVQIKDGGDGYNDSFPSWALKVEAARKTTLLRRQPFEKSHWLGQFLARWAGVQFVEAVKD